jgi:hypothetical protein
MTRDNLPHTQNEQTQPRRLMQQIPSANVVMNTNKEVDIVSSENNQKAFDADKAKTFSEKL